ncbi:MAG: AAA family ATPase [Nanoarchaeota archaeon]
MVYKICFSSTHGVGKTALAAYVEGNLIFGRGVRKVKRIEELSTRARDSGLPINENTTLAAQMWIQHQQFADEIFNTEARTTSPPNEVVICDRGPENYCYLKRRFGENESALQMTLGHLKWFPYSRIYLLPIVTGSSLVDDGVRSVDFAFQQEMDQEIRQFFNKYSIEHIELPQPKEDFRSDWGKMVVNQTLKDLNKPEEYLIR